MDGSKDIPSAREIEDELERASYSDLLDEVLRRGLIEKTRQWPAPGPGDETTTGGTI